MKNYIAFKIGFPLLMLLLVSCGKKDMPQINDAEILLLNAEGLYDKNSPDLIAELKRGDGYFGHYYVRKSADILWSGVTSDKKNGTLVKFEYEVRYNNTYKNAEKKCAIIALRHKDGEVWFEKNHKVDCTRRMPNDNEKNKMINENFGV